MEDKVPSRKGNVLKWVDGVCFIITFCLIMFVSTYFSLVGNLTYNATRFSLSNEPFLFNKIMCSLISMICLHFHCCFMKITHLPGHTFYICRP
jgi:ABC-type uncharacterized transport system permease subunit